MIRKTASLMVFVVLLVSSPALADMFVIPYGAFTFFNKLSTHKTLDIDIGADFLEPQSVDLSRMEEAASGGITIGTRSDDSRMVLALNAEYIIGSNNELFVVYDQSEQDYTVAELKIDAPAIAVGGFLGATISGSMTDRFQSFGGIEVGIIKPTGSLTLKYHQTLGDPVNVLTESQDLDETSLYVSFLFTQTYSFSDTFGLAGTLGWRSANTKIQSIETKTMSGSYGQQYGGVFARLGLDVQF